MENEDFGERAALMDNSARNALTQFPSGFVIYAGWDVEDAKRYINENGLTKKDVRLLKKSDGQVLIKLT